jgi:putative transcriptional regulator
MDLSARTVAASGAAPARDNRTYFAALRMALLTLMTLLIAIDGHPAPSRTLEPKGTSSKPFFLVANPEMPDPIFSETVILMLPSATPPLVAGIVINKPTKLTLGQFFNHSSSIRNQSQPVYFGGPVDLTSESILTRASRSSDTSSRLFENVYISTDTRAIPAILHRPESDKDTRLFLGRAQWTEEQLHAEILQGAWVLAPADPTVIFSPDPENVWRTLIEYARLREVEKNFEDPQRIPLSSLVRDVNPVRALQFTTSRLFWFQQRTDRPMSLLKVTATKVRPVQPL